jgi:hypothetical protein
MHSAGVKEDRSECLEEESTAAANDLIDREKARRNFGAAATEGSGTSKWRVGGSKSLRGVGPWGTKRLAAEFARIRQLPVGMTADSYGAASRITVRISCRCSFTGT